MSDLISKKALLKKLKEYVETVYECDFDDPQCTADGGSLNPKFVQGLWEAKEIIEDQPTAYDVDKVVEQLKECERYVYDAVSDDDSYVIDTEKAIEIVKGAVKDVHNSNRKLY